MSGLCSRSSTRACRPTRFCAVIGVPERTWLRHQARARASRWQRGLWPRPARDRCVRRRGGMRWRIRRGDIGRCGRCAATTAWRCPRPACCACSEGEGLLLEANYQRERRQLAARRKAAFAVEPTAPNQVWQLDFTEFETTTGGTSVGIALGELAERSAGEAFGLGEGKFGRGDGF